MLVIERSTQGQRGIAETLDTSGYESDMKWGWQERNSTRISLVPSGYVAGKTGVKEDLVRMTRESDIKHPFPKQSFRGLHIHVSSSPSPSTAPVTGHSPCPVANAALSTSSTMMSAPSYAPNVAPLQIHPRQSSPTIVTTQAPDRMPHPAPARDGI